jgi:peptidyl-prolyl cis-trans isomerase C
MPLIVNGQVVPEELIQRESERLSLDPQWKAIVDVNERSQRLRAMAELASIHRVLVNQEAAADRRPIDAAAVNVELERHKRAAGCPAGFNDAYMRQQIELQLRVQRVERELVAGANKPSGEQVFSFYEENRGNFKKPEMFHASHIIVHVNESQSEEQANARIEAARMRLEVGEDFAAVAEGYSDCKGNGGNLGWFPAGHMVEEFENALRAVRPGERTDVFTTPFGFHIAELHDVKTDGLALFDEARGDIERFLIAMSENQEFLRGVEQLRIRATITRTPDIHTHNGN